jgi:polyisoprenoid-binding protein YceI
MIFRATVLLAVLTAGAFAQSGTKTFYANDEKQRDMVTFTSKAPLETVIGKTGAIVGFVETDPADITNTRARFEVDLATLKTGIEVRDGHMRKQYLETDKYPKAIFELTRVIEVSQRALEDRRPIDFTAEGNFTVHGVTKTITIPMTVTYYQESDQTKPKLPGDLVRIAGAWDVLLSEYKIARPQFIIMKLDDKQKINIDVLASTGSPAVAFYAPKAAQ